MMGYCPYDGEECRHDGYCDDCEYNHGEEKTMRWINAEKVIHTQIYDDEHEEWSEREMTIEEFLDAFTDEGCPTVVTQPEPYKGES